MAAIRHMALWRRLQPSALALLLVAVAFSLVRSRDQPGLAIGAGDTSVRVTPGDVLLLTLLVVCLARFRSVRMSPSLAVASAGGALFAALVLVTSALNGGDSLVAGGKLIELGALSVGVVVLVRSAGDLEAIVDVLLLFTIAADAVGLVKFVTGGGGRQSSFLGEHDFAALATLPLVYGLVLVFRGTRGRRAALAIAAGGVGCILGAALASLLGLYLGLGALVAIALAHRQISLRPLLIAAATVAAVSAGTLTIRSGDLGFLQSWFGKPPERPGQYAASWSQRLIFTYIDGRVFLDQPLLGTGWYPLLPPEEFTRYLPDARRRFPDQPPRYFPNPRAPFVPQQSFDQIPAELGLVGSGAFLALLGGAAAAALAAARRSALPAAWFAAMLGAIAGEALFGGTPLVATVCIVIGTSLASAAHGAPA